MVKSIGKSQKLQKGDVMGIYDTSDTFIYQGHTAQSGKFDL